MTCTHTTEACIYNVYVMYNGTVWEDRESCDFDQAYAEFQRISNDADHSGQGGQTVHLYDTVLGNMIAEHHVN